MFLHCCVRLCIPSAKRKQKARRHLEIRFALSTTTMALEISLATDADIKTLAAISTAALEPDTLQHVVWRQAPSPADATKARAELAELDLYLSLHAPHCRVFKATVPRDAATPPRGLKGKMVKMVKGGAREERTIVGFGTIQFHHDGIAEYALPDWVPEGFDSEVNNECGRRTVEMHRRHLGERRHVGTLAIHLFYCCLAPFSHVVCYVSTLRRYFQSVSIIVG